jgi:hypothetical protein
LKVLINFPKAFLRGLLQNNRPWLRDWGGVKPFHGERTFLATTSVGARGRGKRAVRPVKPRCGVEY